MKLAWSRQCSLRSFEQSLQSLVLRLFRSSKLTSSKHELARSLLSANSGEGLANTGSHGKVRESSDSSDEEGGSVHETVSVRSALGRDEEKDRGAGHDEENGPEVSVTILGGFDGVVKMRGNGRDADVGLLEGVEDVVVVERVHLGQDQLQMVGEDGSVVVREGGRGSCDERRGRRAR